MNNGNESFDKKEQKRLQKEQRRLEKLSKPHPLKYTKAGVILTRAEVAEIKAARKQLHRDI